MEKDKVCKISESCNTHHCTIIGGLFLAAATVLTLLTLNGSGIFGMFVVGILFCCHKHMGNKNCCECKCCSTESTSSCTMDTPKKTVISNEKKVI